jgi:hypothetical protein
MLFFQKEVFYTSNAFLHECNRDLDTKGRSVKLSLGSYFIVSVQVTRRVFKDLIAFGAYDEGCCSVKI